MDFPQHAVQRWRHYHGHGAPWSCPV